MMEKTKFKLNKSQKEILMSEQASAGTSLNTISVKLRLRDFGQEQVKDAADTVFMYGDVFSARISHEGDEYFFVTGEKSVSSCIISGELSLSDADKYFVSQDLLPLPFQDELYRAEVIPIREGGVFLYVRFHHLITDGFGMCIFVQKVLDLLAGKGISPSVFFDSKNGEEIEYDGDEAFWKSHFSGADFEASLFPVNTRGFEKTVYREGHSISFLEDLKTFAKETGVSLTYVLFSAYGLYLAEATEKDEAVILMPRLNRKQSQMNTIGCYTLLVPVRIKIDRQESFSQLCQRVMGCAREASRHKGTGYANIMKIAGEECSPAGSLSEYVFNYYSYKISSDIEYELDISVAGAMRNHLTWNIFCQNRGMSFSLDLRRGVYDRQKALYFTESIKAILSEGFKNTKVRDIPIIGKGEKAELLSVKGKTVLNSSDETIPSLFRRAAKKYGNRTALFAGNESLNFAELDRVSDVIAAALITKGVKCGDFVAFMLPRDIRLIPAMLGITKAGAAFIPVDPAYPTDRIRYILQDSGASFLISTESVASSGDRDYLEIDDLLKEKNTYAALPKIWQEQTAYIIYTSGTTGKPKGVMLSHRGIVNIVNPDNNPFNRDITKNGRGIVSIGSICFDISLFEIFVPLMNGLFVVLGTEKSMLDGEELAELIQRHGADLLHCTPSRLAVYLGKPKFSEAVKGVQAILSAGEVLPESLVDELTSKYGIRIYNGYGPTETTIGATITEAGDNKTIGMPISNTGILLLNKYGKQVSYGAVGEICIYGDGVGIGYLGREEETQLKFTYWEDKRIYRTGDLGHFTGKGNLVYQGRNDRQIKLRGLRIELSEIERVILSYPGIVQANCILRKIDKNEHLAAFYTTDGESKVTPDVLKAHMMKSLTAYMVPDILKELPSMPQTPGGKTDLKALVNVPVELAHLYRAPQSHLEKMICLSFAAVLGADGIGLDDNFFELGGDSLASVNLMLEIEEKLGLGSGEIEYTDIYHYPTPALLADKLSGKIDEVDKYTINNLDYTGIDEYLSRGAGAGGKNLGNVLLTGATGYLGIHILIQLLKNEGICDRVYCLVRAKGKLTPEKRIKSALFYYAEEDFTADYGSKWMVLEGDISNSKIFEKDFEGHIDTIINSAANVSHFAYGDALTKINLTGVENLIRFALRENAAFCQISTISVGGVYRGKGCGEKYTERNLYIGQEIHNQYIYTKYMAEYALLRAAVDSGLRVKIMRVGNLQGRSADGEFQMNMKSNAFTRQLSSYIKMNAVPESVYSGSVNFSPVDDTAHMIISLVSAGGDQTIFHVYPPQEVLYKEIFDVLGDLGNHVSVLPEDEFEKLLIHLKRSDDGKELVEGLLTERPSVKFCYVPSAQDMTEDLLRGLGEKWTPITEEYLKKYLTALRDMDMF